MTIGVLAVSSLLALSACGSKAASSSSSSAGGSSSSTAKAFNACMVLDTGGVDDKSFNQSSYAGMTAAAKADPKAEPKHDEDLARGIVVGKHAAPVAVFHPA